MADRSALVAGLGLAGVVAFTASFLILALRPPPREKSTLALLAVSVALAIALTPLGGPSVMYLMTIGALGASLLTLPAAISLVGLVAAAAASTDAATGARAQAVFTDATITVVIGLFTFGLTRLINTNKQLAAVRQEVARLAV
ncbi:MAG TPA: hypothetical protein VGR90_04510, partial [Acidimicrobiales bacterium]|nr:hypothetical protein [Acidimicrobiales bacterium]